MDNCGRFYGTTLNGEINYFDFNNPVEGHKNVLMWNRLLDCYMYSGDAGLTWQKVEGKEHFDLPYPILYKIDVEIIDIDILKREADRLKKSKHYSRRELKRLKPIMLYETICNASR